MSGICDINYVASNIGAYAGTTQAPLWLNASSNGKITVDAAYVMMPVAATASLHLVYMDTTGATVQGTIGTFGSASNIYGAGTPLVCTIATAIVPADKWIGIKSIAGTGTNTVTIVSVGWSKGV